MVQQLDPVAMYVNGTRSFPGNQGHAWNNGGKWGNSKKERPVCTYCGFTGHVTDKCYKLHGYPLGYKPKGGTKAIANQIIRGFGFDGPSNARSGDVTQPNIGFQTPFGVSQSCFGGFPSGFGFQACQQTTQPQCPMSQVQCEQLLNFLKVHNASSYHLLPISQVIPLGFPPNFSHSIFSAQVIDRQCFKSNSWIINIGATDHMVHSVSQLITITSIVYSCVYLPNGEKDVVTHIGTVQISSTLILINVLCVASFSFNLISVSKLTQTKLCCLIFLGDSCFI